MDECEPLIAGNTPAELLDAMEAYSAPESSIAKAAAATAAAAAAAAVAVAAVAL